MKSLAKKLAFLAVIILILSGCSKPKEEMDMSWGDLGSWDTETNVSEETKGKPEESKKEVKETKEKAENTKKTPKKTSDFEEATVVRVVDGDTIHVEINGEKKKVRLILVDTPESVHPRKPVEFYGKEASAFTTHELDGKTVYLEKDVSDTDRYGRLLRYVWLDVPEGKDLEKDLREKCFNAKLLLQGYANLSTFPPDVKYVDYFRFFEKSAREAGLGLWNAEAAALFNGEEVPKEEPKEDVKEEPKEEPKEEVKEEIKEETKKTTDAEVKTDTKENTDTKETPETKEPNKTEETKTNAQNNSSENSETASATDNTGETETPSEDVCYIYPTGKKFHVNSSCSSKSVPKKVTVSEAESMGYTPCKKCAKKYLHWCWLKMDF